MFIKNLDYLSPAVTFYYKGILSHSSIISGIISIISFTFILILGIYFSLDLIYRSEPKAYYFNSYVEDAGIFPLNSSSIFHFISIATVYNGYKNDGIDFTNFRIIGYETYFESYMEDRNINKYDHWLYGKCNNSTDTEGISNLVSFDFFEKSACIKKFFNSKEKKYFDIGETNFRWPEIAHGTSNPNAKIYSIFMEKCQEDTLNLILGDNYHCKNDSEIDESFNTVRISNFYFINNYINVLNYENPNTKFFQRIENGIYKNQYSINHLNFFPSKIKTHNGLIFDNIEEEYSYFYDRSDVFTDNNNQTDIYMGYCLWLKNTMNYYERNYKRLQEVISSIGGIYQVITIVAAFINSFYNNYIVLSDTRNLLISSIDSEKDNYQKNEKYKNLKNKIKEKKEKKNNDIRKGSDRTKINNESANSINNMDKKNKSEIVINKSHNNSLTNYVDISIKSPQQMIQVENKNKISKSNPNIKDKEIIKFWNYIIFKISCKKKYKYFDVYIDFRKRIISEEHLVKNHLNIYNLLKITERKRNRKRASFLLENLINLV